MKKKPHVLFDFLWTKRPYTGLCTYCTALSLAFSRLYKGDFSHYFYNDTAKPSNDGVLDWKRRFWHKWLFSLPNSFDIFHCTLQSSRYVPTLKKHQKLLLTVHDLNFLVEKLPETYSNKLTAITKKNCEKADHIICISKFVKKDVMRHFSIPEAKISVVYNGTSFEKPTLVAPKFEPQSDFILSLGRIEHKKNFHVLLPLLQNNNDHLILAGTKIEDDYIQKIEQSAIKLSVQNRVHILGSVTENDKHWYLKHCKSFCFPSIAEGFGLPVLEAMHYEKPCFLSNHCSLPEVGGDWAYYFPSFDPQDMQEVYQKGLEHHTTVNPQDIQQWARQFSWKKTAQAYITIYQSIFDDYNK